MKFAIALAILFAAVVIGIVLWVGYLIAKADQQHGETMPEGRPR